jgi:hypothetical protein
MEMKAFLSRNTWKFLAWFVLRFGFHSPRSSVLQAVTLTLLTVRLSYQPSLLLGCCFVLWFGNSQSTVQRASSSGHLPRERTPNPSTLVTPNDGLFNPMAAEELST